MNAPIAGLASVDLPALVAEARRLADPPVDSAVVLEGSLAEGFGNETSDIDIVFLSDAPGRYPTMPTVVFLQDRRAEIRIRTLREGFRQLREVTDAAARGPRSLSRISRDLIDRVQRIGKALTIEATEHCAELQAACAAPSVARIIRDWYCSSADDALLAADTLAILGDEVSALAWCRTAGIHTVKSWLAERGDTYIESKWYGRQLQRATGGSALLAELEDLLAAHSASSDLPLLLRAVADFRARHLTAAPVRIGGRGVLRRNRRVTTWRIGRNLHVVGPDQSVYVLGDTAARIWSSLPFGACVADTIRHCRDIGGADAGSVLGELLRLGLITVSVRGRGVLQASRTSATLPLDRPVHIGVDGAVRPSDFGPLAIRPLPIRAKTFVEAGMSLVWGNVVVENALEDIDGALKQHEWVLLSVATRRCVRFLCVTALSAHGVAPAPADEESVAVAGRLGVIDHRWWTVAEQLVSRMEPLDATEATATVETLRELVAGVRSQLPGGDALPFSFASADDWSDTLAVGGDWIRLAVYLGVRPPKEEAQDLVATDQPSREAT